jgi:ATP/maltotriose-dependent transcriptional regulator MalT
MALFAWGLVVLAFSAGGLADVTKFWWLVLLFGTAAPVALVAVRGRVVARAAAGGVRKGERELFGALDEHGELTPTAAAMLTSLTAAEASEALERLVREEHLEARTKDGTISYALHDRDRLMIPEPPPEPADQSEPVVQAPVQPLEEPLSDRELAVLKLLADGHTNRQIAHHLFIAQGTVKAHVASIYRKLGVHSRAEAVSRARDLHLLE